MSKVIHREDFRVVVSPRALGNLGFVSTSDSFLYPKREDREREYNARCESIKSDIRRHVDDVGSVSVEWTDVPVCEHCGYAWTEKSDAYNGGCCDKDEQNNPDAVALLDEPTTGGVSGE